MTRWLKLMLGELVWPTLLAVGGVAAFDFGYAGFLLGIHAVVGLAAIESSRKLERAERLEQRSE